MKYEEALGALKYDREQRFALIGSENYLKESFVRKAKEILPDCDCMEFYQEEDALDFASSGTFFSKRLMVLQNFDKMTVAKFEDLVFDGYIIYVMTEKANLKSRAMTGILGHAASVTCDKLKEYGSEYPSWVISKISEEGYKAQEGVSIALFNKVGPNMYALMSELEKLFLIKRDKVITLNDVDKYVSILAVGTSFDLLENLLKRDVKKALMCFDTFARGQDNFIDVTGFLASYLEKMYRILLLHEEKMDPKDIAEIVGMPLFLVKTKYLPKLISLGRGFIGKKIDALCQVDVDLRLFRGSKRLVMERYFMDFSN